ncbi:MAG: DUF4010 domain-containing protein [Planctomycetaceae bacterium]|nr:DUF4010 domain-containing protein [Planctomycetaceae bacterium]
MDQSTRLLFENLGIALLLGLLVGLQRERRNQILAGLRTFPLITVLGTLSAVIDTERQAHGWIIAAGFLAVAAATIASNLLQIRGTAPDYGMTTVIAILVMYTVGAYLPNGHRMVAVAIGGGVAVLLEFKPELHGFVGRLGDVDLRAIMKFVLITCVVLPVLPNRTYDVPIPLDILNPFEIWLMIVLMVGISLGGYLAYKFFGRNTGILLGGLLGGLVSSTATTASFARHTRRVPESTRVAALVILIATAVVYGRVLLEIGVVAPTLFTQMALPIVIPMVSCLLTALIIWIKVRSSSDEMPEQTNPAELKSAIIFGFVYAAVLMMLAAARTWFGSQSLYAVAILSGMTDMDAITLSTARMAASPEGTGIPVSQAWRLIVVASSANLVFKAALASTLGHRMLATRLIVLFSIPLATGLCVLAFWPG